MSYSTEAAAFPLLRDKHFRGQWNVGYSHDLNDDKLRINLQSLCEDNVLEIKYFRGQPSYWMTPFGGDLWSRERCPIWDRYCVERYKHPNPHRQLMSVQAVSPQIRDDFLERWPIFPARRRTATIRDLGLIKWRPLGQVFVGRSDLRAGAGLEFRYLGWLESRSRIESQSGRRDAHLVAIGFRATTICAEKS